MGAEGTRRERGGGGGRDRKERLRVRTSNGRVSQMFYILKQCCAAQMLGLEAQMLVNL